MEDDVKEVVAMRLYDILNVLATQMEANESDKEEIIIRAFNTHSKKNNILTVTLEETK